MLKRSSDDPRNGLLKRRNPYQNSYILDIAVDVTQSAVERINPETNVLCWNLLVNFTFWWKIIEFQLGIIELYGSFELLSFLADNFNVGEV